MLSQTTGQRFDFAKHQLKQSAVSVLIELAHNKQANVILTQRQHSLRSHPGQFSFPGGKFDELVDQSLAQTASRETKEEIGLEVTPETAIKINTFYTLSGYKIEPYVNFITPPYQTKINTDEVHQIIKVPLAYLCQPWQFTKIRIKKNNARLTVYAFSYQGALVWGATAGILVDLASRLSNNPTGFIQAIPEF
ncbi:NUDIX hydrolase [Saccharobesus litoralis]|uniref:NUDIX hydrolase n=1 Tax=Saccharobesus litoralis TaxID=2172099 RepID=UPI00131F3362|nr:CoA pyrophosphatase [Saccharobesus litoralis]